MMNKSFSEMQREAANAQFRADLDRTRAADIAGRIQRAKSSRDVSDALRTWADMTSSDRLIHGGG